MKKTNIVLGAALAAAFAATAHAEMYGFTNISGNDPNHAAIGEAQLSVGVSAYGTDGVLFSFANSGPAACSITDVYFDDGQFTSVAGLIDKDEGVGGHAGVDFSRGAWPRNLPWGERASPPFDATVSLSADSDFPIIANGVQPGEWLGVILNLAEGQTFPSVIADLASGALRVGVYVQGFGNGELKCSTVESFVNTPGPAIPAPAAAILALTGLGSLGWLRRRMA